MWVHIYKISFIVKHVESKSNAMLKKKKCTTNFSVPGFISQKYQKSPWMNKTTS